LFRIKQWETEFNIGKSDVKSDTVGIFWYSKQTPDEGMLAMKRQVAADISIVYRLIGLTFSNYTIEHILHSKAKII